MTLEDVWVATRTFVAFMILGTVTWCLIPIGLVAFPVISAGLRLTQADSDDPWIGPLTSVKLPIAWTAFGLFRALGLIDEIGMSPPTTQLARETSIWDLKDVLA